MSKVGKRRIPVTLIVTSIAAIAAITGVILQCIEMNKPRIAHNDGISEIGITLARLDRCLTGIELGIADSVRAGINRAGARGSGPSGTAARYERDRSLKPLSNLTRSCWYAAEDKIKVLLAGMDLEDTTLLTVDFLSSYHDDFRKQELRKDSILVAIERAIEYP